MATIKEVSKLAGVSIATVSRVLNKKGYVNKKTEEAILAAIEALQYRPNESARSLAGKSTSTIALMVPDILNPFFPELAKAIEKYANEYGYTIILCNSDNDISKEKNYFNVLINKRIDGLILASYTVLPEQILELQKRSIPVVVIDNSFPDHPIIALVSKNREGARLAVEHLLSQGCGKIGHIAGPSQVTAAHQRCLGYEDVCGKLGWFLPSLIERGNFHVDGGYGAMMELIKRHPDLDGVFAGNDLMAVGALKALYASGIKVPDQVKLIGFDGISVNTVVPELTTMVQQISSMGHQAMHLLYQTMKGEQVERKTHELEVELLIRQSTMNTAESMAFHT
jgi:LacI family transcriptional regulator